MLLQEEYYKRHGIAIPMIRYERYVNVVLRNSEYQWLVFSGSYQENKNHPGHYNFYYLKPKHNGYSENLFENLANYDKCYWDRYEYLILTWLNGLSTPKHYGFKAIVDSKELLLVAWEIFLYTHDRWIANNTMTLGSKFYDLVEESTNPAVELTTRIFAYQKALSRIEESATASNSFKNNIACYTKNYSFWLANLINK